jgi:hypothetical protein
MATRRAILHLGTYKTGSSSIQNLCHANRGRLLRLGVLYPKSGLIKDAVIGHRHRNMIIPFMKGATSSYVIEPFKAELEASPASSLIVSNESWSHPRHMPMLGGFRAELEDLGVDHVTGVAVFRRLVDYKVSHYREFTLRQGNKIAYERYILGTPGMFDYLFVARNFRAIFGADLQLLDYAASEDSVAAFFAAAGLSELLPGLKPVPPANVRPIRALGTEAMRQANLEGLPREKGQAFLARFRDEHPDLHAQDWTERETPERPSYGSAYRRALSQTLGWAPEAVERLLESRPIEGRPVSEARPVIKRALKDWIATQETAV